MRNKNVFLNHLSLCIFFFYHRHKHNSKIYEGKKNNVTQTREKQHQKGQRGKNQDQSLDQALYGILSDRHSAEITQGDLHPTRSCPSFNVSLFL